MWIHANELCSRRCSEKVRLVKLVFNRERVQVYSNYNPTVIITDTFLLKLCARAW